MIHALFSKVIFDMENTDRIRHDGLFNKCDDVVHAYIFSLGTTNTVVALVRFPIDTPVETLLVYLHCELELFIGILEILA